jgi:replicative DNA helicase
MNDLEYEQKVISNLIQSPDAVQVCLDMNVSDRFFKFPETKWMYKICLWYYQQYRQTLKSDAIQSILQQSKSISEPLQKQILVMFETIKTIEPVSNFKLLLDEFFQYYKSTLYKQAVQKSLDWYEGKNLDQAMLSLKADLAAIDRSFSPSSDTGGFIGEDIKGFFDFYLDKKDHPEKYRGIMTGFPSFDSATAGLQKGTVTLIFGAAKSAKSVLMVNIVRNVMRAGKRVYYHVNEGGKLLVHQRLISCDTGIPYNPLRNCTLLPEDEQRLKQYVEQMTANNNIFIDSVTPSRSTASYIDNKLREMQSLTPADLVIVDHMGLMTSEAKHLEAEWQRIAHIAIELKSVAMAHNVPIIVITHANRGGVKENKSKDSFGMEDISDSFNSLKHVDLICSWKIKDRDQFKVTHSGTGILSIEGARDSEEPSVQLNVNTNIMKIEELVVSVPH